jgi:hypothetical protein
MRPDPSPVYPGPALYSIKTSGGEPLIVDKLAKLEKGCQVVVMLDRCPMLVGRILRRPMRSRHLLIGYRDVHGNQGTTRMFGLKSKGVDIWRVTGIFTPVPF